ncbi:MAG: hypothetical protein ACYC2T_06970 [Bacillota bacterium]
MSRSYPEYDYDLHEELLNGIAASFDVANAVKEYAARIKGTSIEMAQKIGEDFFGAYGAGLIEKSIELGNQYRDRTAELIDEVARKTGVVFPAVPQRHLEAALLATRPTDKWQLNECNQKRIVYTVNQCSVYNALKEATGDVAEKALPCSSGCLSTLNTLFNKLDLNVKVEMEQKICQDGACKFKATYK